MLTFIVESSINFQTLVIPGLFVGSLQEYLFSLNNYIIRYFVFDLLSLPRPIKDVGSNNRTGDAVMVPVLF